MQRPSWVSEIAPHVLIPVSLFALWLTDGHWLAWLGVFLAAGLRFTLRSDTVSSVADLLTQSGIVLLPVEDNSVVQDFLKYAHSSNVLEMMESLRPGAAVTLFDLKQHTHMNGKPGSVKGFTDTGRVVVEAEGVVNSYRPQNLKQQIDIWGHTFTYTRA